MNELQQAIADAITAAIKPLNDKIDRLISNKQETAISQPQQEDVEDMAEIRRYWEDLGERMQQRSKI